MNIKELLKKLKQLRIKANPDNWEYKEKVIREGSMFRDEEKSSDWSVNGIRMVTGFVGFDGTNNPVYKSKEDIQSEYQLKVLQIENALYGKYQRLGITDKSFEEWLHTEMSLEEK